MALFSKSQSTVSSGVILVLVSQWHTFAKLSFNTLEIGHAISARPLDIIKEYCYPEHLFNFFISTFESRVELLA